MEAGSRQIDLSYPKRGTVLRGAFSPFTKRNRERGLINTRQFGDHDKARTITEVSGRRTSMTSRSCSRFGPSRSARVFIMKRYLSHYGYFPPGLKKKRSRPVHVINFMLSGF